ncbi:hypothetical protein L1987_29430 [Smallanthus sonchifolius]|uniref:Uncharacterized protein n=1 Tax=Smallanthus sonchifolius TaxID=185202 RepID=A0ACB9I1I6_9ASTR|nr:hypothetical protein L1987_29430 [Smallanthus sonchifolius]
MAPSYSLILCFFFTLYFKSLSADSCASFSFKNFGHNSSFESVLALYGDAKAVNDGLSVQLSGGGRVTYESPIKFYGGIPEKLVSFSTYFSFSISGSGSRNGDGLAFVVFSDGYPVDSFGVSNGDNFKFLSVGIDTLRNHVGIDLSNLVSLKAANLSSVNLGMINSGDMLQVWIDYESGSRRLEVRLSKFGENRPLDPVLFERVDLAKIWPESERFYVGLSSSSSNGNSSQLCNVYSWSFRTRRSPNWMHSQPLDPIGFKEVEGNEVKIHKKDDCVMRVLSALILGVGLGALGSFVGMFMWTLFAKRRPVSPEEYAVKPVVDSKSFSK